MLELIFGLPLALVSATLIVLLCLFAVGGRALFSRHVLPRLAIGRDEDVFTGNMMQAVMIFYGLVVALIAVSVWQTHSDTGRIVSEEATAIGVLYRDLTSYPEPARSHLQKYLRDYVDYVIREAWPLQQRGIVPARGIEQFDRFQAELAEFEPASERQKIIHAETLRAYNHLIEARRARLDAVLAGLPGMLWWLVVIGAIASIASTFFFRVNGALHAIQSLGLAILVGLIISLILALDRPFRGELALRPHPYELIRDQLMNR